MAKLFMGSRQIKPAPDLVPMQQMTHDVYGCWDAYVSMQVARITAIMYWERIQKLQKAIADHPGHPSNEEALRRIGTLEERVRNQQQLFVTHEAHAEEYWRHIPVDMREKECLHEMFGVESDMQSILGLWHRDLGTSPGAPTEFWIDSTVLMFVSPKVQKVYQKGVQ